MLRSWELPVRICVLEKKKRKKKEGTLFVNNQPINVWSYRQQGGEWEDIVSVVPENRSKNKKIYFWGDIWTFEQSLLRSKRDRMLWRALITHTWTDFLKMTFGSLVGEHEDRTRCYSKLICEMSLNQRTPSGAQSLYCLYKERLRRYVETK